MAKDPAFLFYPADASEDTQFMNRLERGAYFDVLKAQKKFGKFTIEQLRKVLGADFETCWASLEMVLKFEDGLYFIEWVDEKIKDRKKHVEKQSENPKGFGRPPKEFYEFKKNVLENLENVDVEFEISFCEKEKKQEVEERKINYYNHCLKFLNELNQIKAKIKPNKSEKKPLVNVIENENEIKEEIGGVGEKEEKIVLPTTSFFLNELPKDLKLTKEQIENTIEFVERILKVSNKEIPVHERDVGDFWEAFKSSEFEKKEFKNNFDEVLYHFRHSFKNHLLKHGKVSNIDSKINKNLFKAGDSATSAIISQRSAKLREKFFGETV